MGKFLKISHTAEIGCLENRIWHGINQIDALPRREKEERERCVLTMARFAFLDKNRFDKIGSISYR